MTTEEYIVADLILEKAPIQLKFSIDGLISSNILIGKHDLYSQDVWDKIVHVVHSRTSSVRTFLLQEEYFSTIDHNVQHDILTKKGEKAKELGGHFKYKEWEEKQQEEERKLKEQEAKEHNRITWPQKNWFVIMILTAILTTLAPWLLEVLKPKTNQSRPAIQVIKDTVYIYRIDTVYTQPDSTYPSKKAKPKS